MLIRPVLSSTDWQWRRVVLSSKFTHRNDPIFASKSSKHWSKYAVFGSKNASPRTIEVSMTKSLSKDSGKCYRGFHFLFFQLQLTTHHPPIPFLLSCETKGRGDERRGGGNEGREGVWYEGEEGEFYGRIILFSFYFFLFIYTHHASTPFPFYNHERNAPSIRERMVEMNGRDHEGRWVIRG